MPTDVSSVKEIAIYIHNTSTHHTPMYAYCGAESRAVYRRIFDEDQKFKINVSVGVIERPSARRAEASTYASTVLRLPVRHFHVDVLRCKRRVGTPLQHRRVTKTVVGTNSYGLNRELAVPQYFTQETEVGRDRGVETRAKTSPETLKRTKAVDACEESGRALSSEIA
ncbi:hypothetical protein EVAR_89773_1 [Eumeta japonica]|uniref:Uncharacterized protein n=1 Tax=Eumeta variegata TaxID=151549 RepID=A0A4C1XFW4_EUMVA|nr:hypothetical protein EVAR_89773_1 [Eumeta japonica]